MKKHSRRDFMKNTFLGIGGTALLMGGKPFLNFANAENRSRRRHLINISVYGGWDSGWFHSAVKQDDLIRFNGTQYANDIVVSSSINGLTADELKKRFPFSVKHADSDGITIQYQGRNHFMGNLFGLTFNNNDLKKMLVWKGIYQEGQHGIGNQALQLGQNSTYAKSYTALVAASIAANDYVRPLHYVALANAPGDLYLSSAMNTGFEVPTCIADLGQFNQLTQVNPNDLTDAGRRKILEDAVGALSNMLYASSFTRKSSKAVVSSFTQSFWGASQVTNSNLSTSVEFLHLRLRFYQEFASAAVEFVNAPSWGGASGRIAMIRPEWKTQADKFYAAAQANPVPDISSYLILKAASLSDPTNTVKQNQMTTEASRLRGILQASIKAMDAFSGAARFCARAQTLSFNFAMAAYLVREDLSSVVDLNAFAGDDPHGDYFIGICDSFITMRAFRTLLRVLDEVQAPNGKTMLDSTTVVMHTELDRELWIQERNPTYTSVITGTNHGLATSLYMAGYGVNGGAVVGDIHKGPADNTQFPLASGYSYIGALPIDVNTGLPKPFSDGGVKVSTKSLFPTVMSIFDVPIPGQQVTDANAIPALMKKG